MPEIFRCLAHSHQSFRCFILVSKINFQRTRGRTVPRAVFISFQLLSKDQQKQSEQNKCHELTSWLTYTCQRGDTIPSEARKDTPSRRENHMITNERNTQDVSDPRLDSSLLPIIDLHEPDMQCVHDWHLPAVKISTWSHGSVIAPQHLSALLALDCSLVWYHRDPLWV